MGHQLWVSPITGYRRRGTRLEELRSLLGAGITAQAILEPLRSCPASESAVDMAAELRRLDFDVAGVQSEPDGPVIGLVEREALVSGLVRDHRRDLTAADLVSEITPLPLLLEFLRGRRHAFVLVGPAVQGIVTWADLNKPPVRVYLFGLVSLLEMHLSYWIRLRFKHDEWKGHLDAPRVRSAERIQRIRRQRDLDVGLLECLQFCDKRDLVINDEELRGRLSLSDTKEASGRLVRAEDLRNNLAHSQWDLCRGSSWGEVIEIVKWIEQVVQHSDEQIARQQ